jgi:hypothetical protein
MKTIKETKRLTRDVVNAILLIRLMFKEDSSYDILVDIVNIPNKGISNKSESNTTLFNRKRISH